MNSPYQDELKARDIRQKHLEAIVKAAIAEVEAAFLKPFAGFHHTTFLGVMGINPIHLAIWCFFAKDDDLKNAQETHLIDRIELAFREALAKHGYPGSAIPSIGVAFATDEDVQRTCGGNYWHYLK